MRYEVRELGWKTRAGTNLNSWYAIKENDVIIEFRDRTCKLKKRKQEEGSHAFKFMLKDWFTDIIMGKSTITLENE